MLIIYSEMYCATFQNWLAKRLHSHASVLTDIVQNIIKPLNALAQHFKTMCPPDSPLMSRKMQKAFLGAAYSSISSRKLNRPRGPQNSQCPVIMMYRTDLRLKLTGQWQASAPHRRRHRIQRTQHPVPRRRPDPNLRTRRELLGTTVI